MTRPTDPAKLAERRRSRTLENQLSATLTELERLPADGPMLDRAKLEIKRGIILRQLDPPPKVRPPSELEQLETEVGRLEAENLKLSKMVWDGDDVIQALRRYVRELEGRAGSYEGLSGRLEAEKAELKAQLLGLAAAANQVANNLWTETPIGYREISVMRERAGAALAALEP